MPIQGYLNDLYKGTVSSDEDGQYRGTGLGALILKPFVDEQNIESNKQQGAVKREITSAGEDPTKYNLGAGATIYDARGAMATRERERAQETKDSDREYATTTQKQAQAPQMAQINAGIEESRNQNAITNRRLDQQMEMARLDRADAKDQRALELEYQKMRDRKEDMRYNERMEQLDRKDRQALLQSLTAGLASLGAAFAL